MTKLSAANGQVEIGAGLPTILINDQLRIMDQATHIFEELKEGNIDGIVRLAHWGTDVGMDMVDILVFHPDLDEVDLLPRIVQRVKDEVGCPISLDSRNPEALEAALEVLRPQKALINSVTAEDESLASILPLVKKYGAAVVGMPIGHLHGLPKTSDGRIEEANVILQACLDMGIPREDIVMDAICLASSAEPNSFAVTQETLRRLHNDLGLATTLGIGNAGHGMPDATIIDLAYLVASIPSGLDSALVNPGTQGIVPTARAIDFLLDLDPGGRRYIKYYREQKKKTAKTEK